MVEVRVEKLNGKAAGKDEVTREMIKGRGKKMVEWIWRLCNMAFNYWAGRLEICCDYSTV